MDKIIKDNEHMLDINSCPLHIGDNVVIIARGGYLVRGNITHQTKCSVFIGRNHMRKSNGYCSILKIEN